MFEGVFDGVFDGAIGNVIEASIIAALAFGDLGGDMGGGGPGRYGRPGRQPLYNNRGFRDNQGFTLQGERALNPSRGKSFANAHRDIMKRYFQRFGRDKFIQRFGEEGLEALPKSMARSGLAKLGRRAFVGVLGRGGAKVALKAARPLLKAIPLLGGLIDFAINYFIFKEPLGRAAFKSIGALIGGALGVTLGSAIPFFGNIVGGLAGGSLS